MHKNVYNNCINKLNISCGKIMAAAWALKHPDNQKTIKRTYFLAFDRLLLVSAIGIRILL